MNQVARILVVDDDPNLRKTLGDILQIKGYQPIVASNGAEAIDAMAQAGVSLALVDLLLPDMDGLEVMKRIRAISPLTEVIILTGHASMETAINATKEGAFSYMLKPYQMDDLLLNIQHGVERQQAQAEIRRLASYPVLNPNPVIEVSARGELTYLNPAAERTFPDLRRADRAHPLLQGMEQIFALLQQGELQESVREVRLNGTVFEQHISYVREADLIRIYVLDVSSRKHAEEALAMREREQAAVAELGSFALAENALEAVCNRAVTLVAQTLRGEICIVVEAWREMPVMQAATGMDRRSRDQLLDNADIALLTSLTRQAGQPLIWPDTPAVPHPERRALMAQLGVASGISLSIGSSENFFGVLAVFWTRPRDFSKDDTNFLQAVANALSAYVRRKRYEEQVHQLATTDSLTGIANRRKFSNLLEREIDRVRRYGNSLALVMYDIDHFKQVNDTYGHDVGDSVLQGLTALVQENVRAVDVVARWGGEEFLILMPQSDARAAAGVAEKLRQRIDQFSFEQAGHLTVSFGVTAYIPSEGVDMLLKRVDDALYLAKKNGRNRVEILEGGTSGDGSEPAVPA